MRSPDPKVTIVSGDPVTTVRELKAEVGGWASTWPAVPGHSKATGSVVRLCMSTPGRQVSSSGRTARRSLGKRASRLPNAMRSSSRASGAPRQWWMLWPKARCEVSDRVGGQAQRGHLQGAVEAQQLLDRGA